MAQSTEQPLPHQRCSGVFPPVWVHKFSLLHATAWARYLEYLASLHVIAWASYPEYWAFLACYCQGETSQVLGVASIFFPSVLFSLLAAVLLSEVECLATVSFLSSQT